ncbi:CbbQ/NirQ/NorQ/GpvN family protein [Hydrocarboniclastica marina]|uniref:CbbQ/NirQ/NorQ/GpvN family protein n=1 Tax=Hydrocarboniclastica marina TaxID=2259620 RepID=A0A4P7XHD5_9ALTE|nr:CbbQ/NirQ/NorQ/GpvN family protein [Hydrocarboniclastica marina]MAL99321.1 AAA family ATPase [Alteromonadaceae bacterium]QCF26063.1 CbbQ/NirQ/NorQ/GpvN family protein [Hydrocarboniclastica marina]
MSSFGVRETEKPAVASVAPSSEFEGGARQPPRDAPFYLRSGNEAEIFEQCHKRNLAVALKGPTGCGKTRFVEHMAWHLGRPLITVSCHDDLSATDLLGRYLIRGNETVWQDGPLARAVRMGAICYLDEVMEARQDTIVVIHSLTDHRRILPIDKTGELVPAAPGFQLVISFNPGYQHAFKDLKPSTRQRFVALDFSFPPPEQEAEIVMHESGVDRATGMDLVNLGSRMRDLTDQGLAEVPSTRLLVATGRLIQGGIAPRQACYVGLISPLTDDPAIAAAMRDLVNVVLVD